MFAKNFIFYMFLYEKHVKGTFLGSGLYIPFRTGFQSLFLTQIMSKPSDQFFVYVKNFIFLPK